MSAEHEPDDYDHEKFPDVSAINNPELLIPMTVNVHELKQALRGIPTNQHVFVMQEFPLPECTCEKSDCPARLARKELADSFRQIATAIEELDVGRVVIRHDIHKVVGGATKTDLKPGKLTKCLFLITHKPLVVATPQ